MLTSNSIINDLIGYRRPMSDETFIVWYKNIKLTLSLKDDHYEIKSASDEVTVLYSYSPEETKLCLDMLCDNKYYEIESDEFSIYIYCDGGIEIYEYEEYFVSVWHDKMPFIQYITKTRLVLIEMCNMNISTKTEFIEIYDSIMSCSQTKNARN